jgi:hypothetical protein
MAPRVSERQDEAQEPDWRDLLKALWLYIASAALLASTGLFVGGLEMMHQYYHWEIPAGTVQRTEWTKGGERIRLTSGDEARMPAAVIRLGKEPLELVAGTDVDKRPKTFEFVVDGKVVSSRDSLLRKSLHVSILVPTTLLFVIAALAFGICFGPLAFLRVFPRSKSPGQSANKTQRIIGSLMVAISLWISMALLWGALMVSLNLIS